MMEQLIDPPFLIGSRLPATDKRESRQNTYVRRGRSAVEEEEVDSLL